MIPKLYSYKVLNVRILHQSRDLLASCHVLTSDGPPEDPAGCSEVVWTTRGVGVHPLTQESQVLHCRKEQNKLSKQHILPRRECPFGK